jgi:hypothetical protein
MLVDVRSELYIDPHFADIRQALDDLVEVAGAWCLGPVPKPGQWRAFQARIVDEQGIEPRDLLGCQRRDQSVGGVLPRAYPPSQTDTLDSAE